MLNVPYKLQHNRPFHTAEDDVCVSWRSLFLTVLHFGAQVCLEDLKTQIHTPPPPKQKPKNKKKEKKKKEVGEKGKTKTPSWGPMQIMCSAFLFQN